MYHTSVLLLLQFALTVFCLPSKQVLSGRQTYGSANTPLVFAHYMLMSCPPNGNYTTDIQFAHNAGIDAFALNYGSWSKDFATQDGYLKSFYESVNAYNLANKASFKLFISVDLTSVSTTEQVITLFNDYSGNTAQLKVDNKVFFSSFQVNPPSWDWDVDVKPYFNADVYLVPGSLSTAYDDPSLFSQTQGAGVFPWVHPELSHEDEINSDKGCATARTAGRKSWLAAVAPWFYVGMTEKNWANAQDDRIFIDRFQNLLQLRPDFIELVTWNDWGESSYFGPTDVTGIYPETIWDTMDHSPFLKMASIFIKNYKARKTVATVDRVDESVYMFYRTQPAATLGTNTTLGLGLPSNSTSLKDNVYVLGFLNEPATVTFHSGNAPAATMTFPAGVYKTGVPWSPGAQSLTASRNGTQIVSKSGGPDIVLNPVNYNGNVVAL